jgi:PEP-CTERM motif
VLSQAASVFNGPSYMYATAPLPSDQRDTMPDFNNFEGGPLPVPNGVVQLHLQTTYDNATQVDDWEIKSLIVRKINPDPLEVARLDGKSGFSLRFGSPFTRTFNGFINVDGTDYDPTVTDQLQRFNQSGFLPNNAFIIHTDDDDEIGGFGVWQSASATTFDATDATIEIRAKLTAPAAGQAASVQLVAKDKDGNGTADAGDFGGEEYHFNVDLSQFNESTMTTISIPFQDATIEQAQEFATAGDGLLSDFNLYYLGMLTNQDAGLVDLEVEYVRVVLPGQAGWDGDFNGNNSVENADLTLLLNNWAQPVPPVPAGWVGQPQPTGPAIDNDELTALLNNWGKSQGGGSNSTAVPEPASWTMLALAVSVLIGWRRQAQGL